LSAEIGLQEMIEQLKKELLQDSPDSPRLFFIEGVEIELHVTAKRAAKGGIQISVLQFGGLEAGGSAEREKGHKITLKLLPLVTYEEARQRLSESQRAEAVLPLMKGAQ